VNQHPRILSATDRLLAVLSVALLLGSAICFGGAVWWFRPAFAVLALAFSLTMIVRLLLERRLPYLKSPLTPLGFLALGLGILQLTSLPAPLARRLSPAAQEIYSFGVMPGLARADFPGVKLDEPAQIRSPATLDRSGTLRWLLGALACLGIFWTVSHFADRLKRLYLIWGCVVTAFLLNGAFGLVQIAGGVEGLLGYLRPGAAPFWAPSVSDLLDAPTKTTLRRVNHAALARASAAPQPAAVVPEQPVLMGTMIGGHGGFLAFGSLALPLGLAIVLHTLAPRGSRESLSSRLSHKGQGSLVVLLLVLLVASGFLVGMSSGPLFSVPFIVGLAVVGLSSVRLSRGWSLGVTTLLVASVVLGVVLVAAWPTAVGGPPPVAAASWDAAQIIWRESLTVFADFPLVGTGMGSFSAIHPYVKAHDASSTTAMSSLLQWGVESGSIGLALLGAMVVWSLWRLRGAVSRVGSADRTLAFGLIGAALGFSLWSAVHWAVELPAVAISASALGGTWNRWLAGGTDLFVDRA
jgi:O-antigen ligase